MTSTVADQTTQREGVAKQGGATPQKKSPFEKYDKFVNHIREKCLIPGSRAALRSGLRRRPEQAIRMHSSVAKWLIPDVSEGTERAYYTVAALIAAQSREARDTDSQADEETKPEPEAGETAITETAATEAAKKPTRRPNLGYSLAEAANRKDAKHESMERRLHLLARQDLDGIHNQLPSLVRYLRGKKVPVDWGQLLADLCRWQKSRDLVAKDWLQTYYRTLHDPGFIGLDDEDEAGAGNDNSTDDPDNAEE